MTYKQPLGKRLHEKVFILIDITELEENIMTFE